MMETGCFWLTVLLYMAAFVLRLAGLVSGRPAAGRVGRLALVAGVAAHTALVAIRWQAGGHLPVTNTYELNLSGAWITMMGYLLLESRYPVYGGLGLMVLLATFLVLGYGYLSWQPAAPMAPDFRSPWLVFHVVFAFLAFGSLLVAAAAALLLLGRERLSAWRPALAIPDPERLDQASHRQIVFGFVCHAVMLATGALWAKQLWGRYWSWDALETWSLIVFLYYALLLHARIVLGWRGRRAAGWTVLGLALVAVSFWGVEWFAPSRHPIP